MAPKHKTCALIGSMSSSPQLCALCGRDRLSFATLGPRGPQRMQSVETAAERHARNSRRNLEGCLMAPKHKTCALIGSMSFSP